LVRIDVPDDIWAAREVLGRPLPVGWDAIPEGPVSRNIGSAWLKSSRTSLLTMPSVIIDEEDNVMVNPAHPDCARINAMKVRRFLYDHRV
jgi:RES domain-containing protein